MIKYVHFVTILVLLILSSCAPEEEASRLSIDFQKYELENGLEVVLHVDRSDPVAAVAMTFHVGSARELEGKTGFAHLFEHLFSLDSENLGQGGLDRLMTRVGSSTNGSTSRDRTNYFEVVPKDELEKTLWAEADKLGYFINTVTESVLAKEKQVVKNEKRQGVDNQPYGHANSVMDRALYPAGHPYQWQVIGSLQDLDNATLEDVHEFHRRWYGPNNATVVVAGDIDIEKTRHWLEKYFGEIPRLELPKVAKPSPVRLTGSRRLYHEDNFANLPQLTLAWPTVPLYHADSYPLRLLAQLLSDGKTAPFYKVVVEEEKLAPAAPCLTNCRNWRAGSPFRFGPSTARISTTCMRLYNVLSRVLSKKESYAPILIVRRPELKHRSTVGCQASSAKLSNLPSTTSLPAHLAMWRRTSIGSSP